LNFSREFQSKGGGQFTVLLQVTTAMKQTVEMQLFLLQVWLRASLLAVEIPLAMSKIDHKLLKRSSKLQYVTSIFWVFITLIIFVLHGFIAHTLRLVCLGSLSNSNNFLIFALHYLITLTLRFSLFRKLVQVK